MSHAICIRDFLNFGVDILPPLLTKFKGCGKVIGEWGSEPLLKSTNKKHQKRQAKKKRVVVPTPLSFFIKILIYYSPTQTFAVFVEDRELTRSYRALRIFKFNFHYSTPLTYYSLYHTLLQRLTMT